MSIMEGTIMARPDPDMMGLLLSLRQQLESAAHGQAGQVIEQFCARHGRSKQTVWRWLTSFAGYDSGRKKRTDAGKTKLPEETLKFIAASKQMSVRANGKQTKPTAVAMNIADANGFEVPVCVSSVNRALRNRNMDGKSQAQARNHTRMRSLHPNHVHEIDPSLCLVFYIGSRQYVMTEQEFNKNKPAAIEKIKLKCWRYVRWDHASRAIDVRYYQAAGENQYSLFEFLLYTWGQQPHRLSHGVPKKLLWDKGSERSSPAVCNWLDAMGVDHTPHATHHAWVKGGVEGANNIVETQFESRLRDEPVTCVEQLNEAVERWVRDYNANAIKFVDAAIKLPDGQRLSRDELWQSILRHPEALVLLPDEKICRWFLAGKTHSRQIRDNLISFVHPELGVSRQYDLSQWAAHYSQREAIEIQPMLLAGGAVRVSIPRMGREPLLVQVEPISQHDSYGRNMANAIIGQEYKTAPHTAAQEAAKDIAKTAYGDVTLDEAEALLRKNARPFQGLNSGTGAIGHSNLGSTELPQRLIPAGRELDLPQAKPAELPRMNRVQMAKWLQGRLQNQYNAALLTDVSRRYPDGATEPELEAVLNDLQAGRTGAGRAKLQAI
ncbi:MAG: transposase [Methylomonas sp.]|nr:MAG: transposase [Methylomonas sp.]